MWLIGLVMNSMRLNVVDYSLVWHAASTLSAASAFRAWQNVGGLDRPFDHFVETITYLSLGMKSDNKWLNVQHLNQLGRQFGGLLGAIIIRHKAHRRLRHRAAIKHTADFKHKIATAVM